MSHENLRQQKRDLRLSMELRRAESARQNPDAAPALRDMFLKHITLPPNAVVSSYVAHGSEMDPGPLTDALRGRGHQVALPIVTGKGEPLLFRLYEPDMQLIPGTLDIPVPPHDARALDPDMLIVPMLAFDTDLYRLGYGGGFYDRTLAALRQRKTILAVGIAYTQQQVTAVPRGPYDARLDKIVTENQVF